LAADSAAIYAPPGYLLFVRQGALLAQPFDAMTQQLGGDPVRLADSVAFDRNAPGFSVSEHGTLTYRTGPAAQSLQFAWFDRTGKLLKPVGAAGDYHGMDLSGDGTRVAVHRHEGNGGDIWIFEARGTTTRLTFDASQDNSSPIWSLDGSHVAFASLRAGKCGVYQKASNGTGAEEPLVQSEVRKNPMAWSPDGKYLVYSLYEPKGTGQWLLPMTGDRKPVPLLNAPFNEAHPQLSPDGKWMAYNSNQTGRAEVYVKPFPSGDGQWQVSTTGGIFPRWRGDGKELFYFTSTTAGKLMAVEVSGAGSTFDVRSPRELFDTGYFETGHLNFSYHVYAVSADGQRFLIPRSAANLAGLAAPAPITMVLNWTAALKK
jgi:WD40 repeat protein